MIWLLLYLSIGILVLAAFGVVDAFLEAIPQERNSTQFWAIGLFGWLLWPIVVIKLLQEE